VPSEQNVESLHVTALYKIATYSAPWATEHLDSFGDACDLYVLLDSRSDNWLSWLWFFLAYLVAPGVRGGAFGCGTALQAGRSRVLFLMESGRTTALGSTQPLMEMGTRNISWRVMAAGGLGLTTLPPSRADCLEIWKPQPLGTLKAYTGITVFLLGSPR